MADGYAYFKRVLSSFIALNGSKKQQPVKGLFQKLLPAW
jgi:hypothetical protein